ncbi:helix-turn-helix domain-containing protein [Shewanella marinintestina]|uniref:helix-turn-helix domain-containing protein n=1 Tax=Shewanella marinintestina TaxID=190305 RepID=UPI00200EFDB8|nr:helix-turn-helix domain-containing protein [Shewanella marinintestina]MCL1147424.1 helix-turn-helix domain-containing protein [Shewanella marinintestina]
MLERVVIVHNEIEELVKSFTHLDQFARQLSSGKMHFSSEMVHFPNLYISRLGFEQSIMFHGQCDADFISFTVPKNKQRLKVNGIELLNQSLYVIPPSQEIIAVYPSSFDGYHLAVEISYLKRVLGHELLDAVIAQSEGIRSGNVKLYSFDKFQSELSYIIDLTLANHHSISPILAFDIQEYIANNLRILFELSSGIKNHSMPFNKRFAVAARASDYINNSGRLRISISELAQHCFCSVRTLEYAFNKVYSITPKQYLTIRRMHLIREELKSACYASVAEVMRKYGVINAGRFSQHYAHLFGEYPSATLRR